MYLWKNWDFGFDWDFQFWDRDLGLRFGFAPWDLGFENKRVEVLCKIGIWDLPITGTYSLCDNAVKLLSKQLLKQCQMALMVSEKLANHSIIWSHGRTCGRQNMLNSGMNPTLCGCVDFCCLNLWTDLYIEWFSFVGVYQPPRSTQPGHPC